MHNAESKLIPSRNTGSLLQCNTMGSACLALAVALLISIPSCLAADINGFSSGAVEETARLSLPRCSDTINFSLPARCHVLNATVRVAPSASGAADHPRNITMCLNDTEIWTFDGTGFGGFGRQTVFSDELTRADFNFSNSGGSNITHVRLPSTATVQQANLTMDCRGPAKVKELFHVQGEGYRACLGHAVSFAGDLNGDGYDDFAAGDPGSVAAGYAAGAVSVYFGGPGLGSTADLVLLGRNDTGMFGYSIAPAGDVNGDGYDDLVVGAPNSNVSGDHSGRASIYLGGPDMSDQPFLTVTGNPSDGMGEKVAWAGDVNGDGYDDVLIGAPDSEQAGSFSGRACLLLGGPDMDNVSDLEFYGVDYSDYVGYALAGAGDVNRDGYDDFVIGAPQNDSMGYRGAFLYLGGSAPDDDPDIVLHGDYWDGLGFYLAMAGDVNGDGFDDIVMGNPNRQGTPTNSGGGLIFYGGKTMDGDADVVLNGTNSYEHLGTAVSGAGDVNGDGYADVILGTEHTGTEPQRGLVRLFLGGPRMTGAPDFTLASNCDNDLYGYAISGGGDVNGDGFDEVLVGAPAEVNGVFYLYTLAPYLSKPSLKLSDRTIWSAPWQFAGNRTNMSPQLLQDALNAYLRSNYPTATDDHGNPYLDIPLTCEAKSGGNIALYGLNLTYSCNASVPDFSELLNDYLAKHSNESDHSGRLNISLWIFSRDPGDLKLHDLNITYDEPPSLIARIPDISMYEDTANLTCVNLSGFFKDDYDETKDLAFSVASAPSPNVTVSIYEGRFLSINASNGKTSENWTGKLNLTIRCADRWNQTADSNPFTVEIRNVNDPPAFDSIPPLNATFEVLYNYQPEVSDGDNDPLLFGLSGPANMTIDTSTGRLLWIPSVRGLFNVSISVTDGIATSLQDFTIDVFRPNQKPEINSIPVLSARVGEPYFYNLTADDGDGDILTYSVKTAATGLTIDARSGRVSWTPVTAGYYSVVVKVTDGKYGEAVQGFVIAVAEAIQPRLTVDYPAEGISLTGMVILKGAVIQGTFPLVAVYLKIDGGEWLKATGNMTWEYTLDTAKLQNGRHTLEVRASDAGGYIDSVRINFTVANDVSPDGAGMPLTVGISAVILLVVTACVIVLARKGRSKRKPPIRSLVAKP